MNRLEEGGVLTDCSILTEEPDETLDFDFSSANVLNKIIMKVSSFDMFLSFQFVMVMTNNQRFW